MILIFTLLAGSGVAVWNTWHRLGRSRRARAWSHSRRPEMDRHVLAVYPMLSATCIFGSVVGLAPEGPVVTASALLFLASGVTCLAYAVIPLPVPRFLQPRWYVQQEAGKGGARG